MRLAMLELRPVEMSESYASAKPDGEAVAPGDGSAEASEGGHLGEPKGMRASPAHGSPNVPQPFGPTTAVTPLLVLNSLV